MISPFFTRFFAQQFRHAGYGMHDIVVQWTTRECQSAGDGQRFAGVQANLPGGNLHGDRKTAVDVDVGEIGS